MPAIKKKQGRKLFIDMDEIHIPQSSFLNANKASWKKRQILKSLDPFHTDPYQKRKYADPKELQKAVDSYFDSCFGPMYYKGNPVIDANGEPVIVQKEPFTISGLARHLKITTVTLYNYEVHSKAGQIPPEYAEIITDAKMRIQEYAEKRLYDRDGSSGARFVLEAGFGWMTKKEDKELRQNKKRIKVSQDKLKLLQEAAAANKLEDKELVVNILKASEDNGSE